MRIDEILKNKKTLSFETFPPKKEVEEDLIKTKNVLNELAKLNPDFISVTYGAGGSNSKGNVELASYIQNELNIEALAHLTGGPSTKEDIDRIAIEFKKNNIENVLLKLEEIDDVVPLFKLKRQKTGTIYHTCCTPQATKAILTLLRSKKSIKNDDPLFYYKYGGILYDISLIKSSNIIQKY